MATYYAAARSNYFAVKDEAAFRKWALGLGLDVITPDLCRTTADGIRRFGIAVGSHGGSGAWPTQVWDAEACDFVTIDLAARLAPHLADGEVAVLMEIGNEALKYFTGTAVAVNGKGKTTKVTTGPAWSIPPYKLRAGPSLSPNLTKPMKHPIPSNTTEPLKVGDRVQIVPAWQDPGDDKFERFVIEAPDDATLVRIRTLIPGFCIHPTEWIEAAKLILLTE